MTDRPTSGGLPIGAPMTGSPTTGKLATGSPTMGSAADAISPSQLGLLGLAPAEALVYMTLVSQGQCTVVKLAESTGLHRTNVYDILEKLQGKGLVANHLADGTQIFSGADPAAFLQVLDERRLHATAIVKRLVELRERESTTLRVEVLRGESGLRTITDFVLNDAKTLTALNIAGQMARFPSLFTYYRREHALRGIKSRFLVPEEVGIKYPSGTWVMRTMPQRYLGVTTAICWNDTLVHIIWSEEVVVLLIESHVVAESFRQTFELLWQQAKPSEEPPAAKSSAKN